MSSTGFIGLGNMGHPMATRLRNAGHELLVGHEPDDLMLRVPAARERGRAARDRRELDEGSTVHQK